MEVFVEPKISSRDDHYPKSDWGYFHLTPRGWERKDTKPFPEDRVETWYYEMECPAEDAKEQVTLARSWMGPTKSLELKKVLHARFGDPIEPAHSRNITLKCYV